MSEHSVSVDVQVASDAASVPGEQLIRAWVGDVIGQVHTDDGRDAEVSIRIVDEEEGRDLNSRYRNIDKATNVLSFPAATGALPAEVPRSFGDIVICAPIVEREAAEQAKDVADHWAHMLVHGALHLLGYDHETDDQAAEMEGLEVRILADRGVADPYSAKS